jgi:HD-like signal output (HDOD) protein/signal transduction histidine kinase
MNFERPTWNKKIGTLKNLPTLPHILLKVINICNDSEGDLRELSEILEKDPSLSIKILKMVNSPYYGLSKKVETILQAVSILGTNAIRNIAVCTSVDEVFDGQKEDVRFNLKVFWWHSLKCAVLAKLFAQTGEQVNADEAFLSGLIHDIGKLVLWTNFGEQYTRVLDARVDKGQSPLKVEAELIANHCEIGAWLLQRWNFGPFMVDAVLYHHEPADKIATALPLVQVIHVANILSQRRAGWRSEDIETAENFLGLNSAEIERLVFRAEEETQTIAQSLNIEIEAPGENAEPSSEIDIKARQDLADTIKQFSLLFGSFQNLLEAEDRETLLKTVHQGFQILFDAENIIFFLRDPDGEFLTGKTFNQAPKLAAIKGLRIPMSIKGSLLNVCLSKGEPLNSFGRPKNNALITLDEQIIRCFGKDGIVCLPMRSRGAEMGVIVIGLDETDFSHISKHNELMRLLTGQAAIGLHVDHLRQTRFNKLQTERLKAAATLSRKVVHEVNTPLSIIKNYIAVMTGKLSSENPVQEELRFISEEIDRVARTIQKLSDFSKSEAVIIESIDLNELISELTKVLLKSGLIDPKIRLHLELDHTLPAIRTDKGKAKQILINLLRNAVEAMSMGGNLFIQTRYGKNKLDKRLNSDADLNLDYAEITFKDDGPGIPDNIKSRVFEAYITTKGAGHSGLGLSIFFNLVQELKGTITCESDSENGTCFRVILPFLQNEAM